ncbi:MULTISPECIES: hypothetical protein [Haloprofundus]|uniref:hypothetical protein n=1 Tax=Haloprofundus TaxID=1911573 RepID=UPI000E4399E2|nr:MULTISPECIES: hypothetical protein [Haloprofundus]QCJ46736.1 hypothetical protein FCF25_06260 [Haloprofundus sp. MHR1]
MNRRHVLRLGVAVVSTALGGCAADPPPQLRIRNFSGYDRTVRVRVTRGEDELFSRRFTVPSNHDERQQTVDEVYPGTGVYTVEAAVENGPELSESVEFRSEPLMSHVTVDRNDLTIGRIAP